MEVSNVRDHVTHAVISAGKTIDFGISDSPEFFHILSSTLYSDQPLAVVREVLCNAWDAHIEAGCANKAVEVTLTDEELIIRDFGKGIHDDDIGQVYGVYGGSTKKNNKMVTGGFGLGCKAPFAYTDHFEVTSCHAGRRTIYNLSKSSAEVHGRPGIVPITSFPTDETGLQVRIPLKSRHDRHRFAELIRRIASNGEMSVVLNREALNVLPFSSMKHGFMVTHLPTIESDQRILVRYGHVVYPVERHADFSSEYKAILKFLESLPDNQGYYKIIFQAKPNSISVTPSRESLSMQEHTINTLKGIFEGFVAFLNTHIEPACVEVLKESIVHTWAMMKPAKLFHAERYIPGLSKQDWNPVERSILLDVADMARGKACWNYPQYPNFRFQDLLTRVDSMIQANFGNVGLIKSYRSELIRLQRRKQLFKCESSWMHRKVVGPLVRDLRAAGLKSNRLTIYGRSGDRGKFRWNETYFTEAARYATRNLEDQLPFLRNIVVLTHNREDVENRVHQFPIMKHWLGNSSNLLVYNVPRTSKKITDQAREFFKARGVQLIDLTVYHSWESAPVPAPVVVKEKKPSKAKGLPILSSLLNGGIRVDFLWHPDEEHDIRRTETPKVVVKAPRREEKIIELNNFDELETISICTLWPNDIAVANTSVQEAKYVAAGAIPLNQWVREQVSAEVLTNTRIHRAIASDINRIDRLSYQHSLKDIFDLIWNIPDLCKEFGLTNDLTETDRHYLRLWKDVETTYRYVLASNPEVKKTADLVKSIKLDPAVDALSKLLETRREQLGVLNTGYLRRHLLPSSIVKGSPKMKALMETTKQIVLLALKG